ncbi:MAG: matrixin family metalloprotease [Planctomycetes bacterium]|nr:matrixin family metalloprotease [Planctomycetota bacterium]
MWRRFIALVALGWGVGCFEADAPLRPAPRQTPQQATTTEAVFACGGGQDRAVCACYAPGTDPAHIRDFQTRFFDDESGYYLYDRWTRTATDGLTGQHGDPITLTYSFVPDTNTGDPETSNVIHAALDAEFEDRATWKGLFREIFDAWSLVTGITFVEVADDGAEWPYSRGTTGQRGDIRFVSWKIDGRAGVLAYAAFPNFGDVCLDRDEDWGDTTKSYRFLRNVMLHELGHAIGLEHVVPNDGTKLMEAFYTAGIHGPQDDDIRGAGWYYGDPHEPNDDAATAAELGSFLAGESFGYLVLHDAADEDWFYFSAENGAAVAVEAIPVGGIYEVGPEGGVAEQVNTCAVNPLLVEVYDESGALRLASGMAGAVGQAVTTSGTSLPAGATGFLVRVRTTGTAEDVQRYRLTLHEGDPTQHFLTVSATPFSDVTVSASPADVQGRGAVPTPALLSYAIGEEVTLVAPAMFDEAAFVHWSVDGDVQPSGVPSLVVTMDANHAVEAAYAPGLRVDAGADQVVVQGELTQLSAVVSYGTPPYEYRWSPPQPLSDATVANPLANPSVTTAFTVEVTDAAGARSSAAVTVEVWPPLRAEAGTDHYVVAGESFSLAGSASGGVPPYSFSWSPQASLISSSTAATNGTVAARTTFTLTVFDAGRRQAADTVTVVVTEPLTVHVSSDRAVALGESVLLHAEASGGVAPYSYSWTWGGAASVASGHELRAEPQRTTVYTVTATDTIGRRASGHIRVTVTGPIRVNVLAAPQEVYRGETCRLEASVAGGTPPYEYAWTPAEGVLTPASAQSEARPAETTIYTLMVRDADGNAGSASVEVMVSDAPDLSPLATGPCGAGVAGVLPLTFLALLPARRWQRGRRRVTIRTRPDRCARR